MTGTLAVMICGGGTGTPPSIWYQHVLTWHPCATIWDLCVPTRRRPPPQVVAPTLVALLPHLFRLQETPDPDFNFVVKQAVVSLKYCELPIACLPTAVASLVVSLSCSQWHARAAALSFAQSFAFRHSFLLAEPLARDLREAVVARLADAKLEVRQLAASTLAGLLKGAGASAAPALRQRFMAAAQQAQAAEQQQRRAAKAAAAAGAAAANGGVPRASTAAAPADDLATRHAAILGLAACVLSCPYDAPDWCACARSRGSCAPALSLARAGQRPQAAVG